MLDRTSSVSKVLHMSHVKGHFLFVVKARRHITWQVIHCNTAINTDHVSVSLGSTSEVIHPES